MTWPEQQLILGIGIYYEHQDRIRLPVLYDRSSVKLLLTSSHKAPFRSKMHSPILLSVLTLFLGLTRAAKPSPTRPFIAYAFQSPFPPNTAGSLSGVPVTAKDGLLYLNGPAANTSTIAFSSPNPNRKDTVFWVDIQGQAWLVSYCSTLLAFIYIRFFAALERKRMLMLITS